MHPPKQKLLGQETDDEMRNLAAYTIPFVGLKLGKHQFEYDIDAFIYWGVDGGKFDANHPHKLPTHYAMQVLLRDLDSDGRPEIIFTGGDHVYIYWNRSGAFGPEHCTIIKTTGFSIYDEKYSGFHAATL